MRTFLAVFFTGACAAACAYPTTESVYDLPTHKYEGNGASSGAPGDPGSSGMDAATCPVQGGASVSGGVTLAAQDAVELFDATRARFEFLITDFANACALGGAKHAGSNVLSITYTGSELRAGDYDLAKTPGMAVTYTTYGAGCTVTQSQTASAGTITIKKLDICGSDATLDVTIGGQQVSASFTASTCALPDVVASCK